MQLKGEKGALWCRCIFITCREEIKLDFYGKISKQTNIDVFPFKAKKQFISRIIQQSLGGFTHIGLSNMTTLCIDSKIFNSVEGATQMENHGEIQELTDGK